MVTIDLTSTPRPAPPTALDGMPRRLTLTLPELRRAAELAGDAPLPFDVAERSAPAHALEGRLGQSRGSTDAAAYDDAVGSLHDGDESLRHRGLLEGDVLVGGLAGALGLLATPHLALEIDVAMGGVHVKAWHRQAGDVVATLSTVDGIVFELAWFPTEQWPAELARVAALPTDVEVAASEVPDRLELPYAALDAVGEALRTGRGDLVPVLLQQHAGTLTGVDGDATAAVTAVHTEGRGRLRVLAAEIGGTAETAETTEVGVVSWVLLADGWHALVVGGAPAAPGAVEPAESPHLSVRRVEPDDLATELAPVLAAVAAGAPR